MKKALIAMSGGVDSSVSAYIMKERGYEVSGATLKLFFDENITENFNPYKDIDDAKKVCDNLGINHYVIDMAEDFRKYVIDNFINTYEQGGTPNPCVVCNKHIKFKGMLETADKLNYDKIVTGHYAKIIYDNNIKRYLLKKADDLKKDQSYVLYSLKQDQLARVDFPLEGMDKDTVREIAEKLGFVNAKKSDSQDICFIKGETYFEYIKRITGKSYNPGPFKDLEGNILGTHKGIIKYTIGQRKGLGLSLKAPLYVYNKDILTNTVTLSPEDMLYKKKIIAKNCNFIPFDKLTKTINVLARTRYNQKEVPAFISPTDDGNTLIEFKDPMRAPAKGQSAVFYIDDYVIGGGTII